MTAPAIVWRPDESLLRDSNVARFMAAEHIDDVRELIKTWRERHVVQEE